MKIFIEIKQDLKYLFFYFFENKIELLKFKPEILASKKRAHFFWDKDKTHKR